MILENLAEKLLTKHEWHSLFTKDIKILILSFSYLKWKLVCAYFSSKWLNSMSYTVSKQIKLMAFMCVTVDTCFMFTKYPNVANKVSRTPQIKVAWDRVDAELPDILTFRRPCFYQKVPLFTCKLSFLISLSKSYKKY